MSTVSICAGRRLADRLDIGFEDREIVLDRPPEAGEAENERFERAVVGAADVDGEPAFLDAEEDLVGSGIAVVMAADRREAVVLDEVVDGDPPLLLDIGIAPDDRLLVEHDVDDAGVGHVGKNP